MPTSMTSTLHRRNQSLLVSFCRQALFVLPLSVLPLSGCAKVTQVQYFEVTDAPDPLTGAMTKSYYRMTLEGKGNLTQKYQLKASYLSAATLDTLNGRIPTIPEADLPAENQKAFKDIKQTYLDRLTANAKALANIRPNTDQPGPTASTKEEAAVAKARPWDEMDTVRIARQAWFASLGDSDLMSLGQQQTANPFLFRKLVFYSSATMISLEEYDKQINSALEKTSTLARHFESSKSSKTKPDAVNQPNASPKNP